jgi:uncharacterized C2H2 Zn-finger protein
MEVLKMEKRYNRIVEKLNGYYFLIDNGYKLNKKQKHEFNRLLNEYRNVVNELDDDIMVI